MVFCKLTAKRVFCLQKKYIFHYSNKVKSPVLTWMNLPTNGKKDEKLYLNNFLQKTTEH